MPMVLRSGRVCVPPPPSTRRRRGATKSGLAQGGHQKLDIPKASSTATTFAQPESAVHILKDNYAEVDYCNNALLWEMDAGERAKAAYLARLYNSYDPRDHVLWSYYGDKDAMCNDLRMLSKSEVKRTFRQLIRVLFLLAFFCLFSHLVWGRPAVWYGPLGSADLIQLVRWCNQFFMMSSWRDGSDNREGGCDLKRKLKGFAGAVPMVPLTTQLDRQLVRPTPSVVFNLRKYSDRKVTSDWDALVGLQRECALPVNAGGTAGPMAGYTLSAKVHDGDIVIQIPRVMSISSLTVPRFLREACRIPQRTVTSSISFLWKGSTSRACSSDEILAFSVFVEKHLQRQAVLEALETSGREGISQNVHNSLPPHPYCLVKSNRKNAPFFSPEQWEVVRHMTHLSREPLDDLFRNLKMTIQETSAAHRRIGVEKRDNPGITAALQTMASDCDEEQLNLDLKDAVSVLYSKSIPDGEMSKAVLPAALELEAGLETFGRDTGAYLGLRADSKVFRRVAIGDSSGKMVSSGITADKRCIYDINLSGGELNNIHLLHRFGLIAPGNPWGSVFFLRRATFQNAAVASPIEGARNGQIRPIFTIAEAETNLPPWLLEKKTIRRVDPMYFHSSMLDSEDLRGAFSRRAGGADVANTEDEQTIRKAFQREALLKPLNDSLLECDYKEVFTSQNFGYGALSLNESGPIGGFRKDQYQCIKVMLSGQSVDTAENSVTYKSLRTLAAAEKKAAEFFLETCSQQLRNVEKASSLLQHTIKPAAKTSTMLSDAQFSGSTTGKKDLIFLAAESEREVTERTLEVSLMMRDAVQAEVALLNRCIKYFTDVHGRATTWM